jgi:Uma2 family endonuclease
MATILKIGPADHGRPIAYDDFKLAEWEEGYQYELIDGKLYVSPQPNLPQGRIEKWIYDKLNRYARKRPEVIDFVYNKARVLVPDRPGVTNPEPDVAAYHAFPLDEPMEEIDWEDVNPVLVVEVVSAEDPDKDLVRNVELYLRVPTIREYWIIDPREAPDRPTMLVYRRRGKSWQRAIEVGFGETYTTKLLPGFKLLLNPRK